MKQLILSIKHSVNYTNNTITDEKFTESRFSSSRTILLHGPPGTGKLKLLLDRSLM